MGARSSAATAWHESDAYMLIHGVQPRWMILFVTQIAPRPTARQASQPDKPISHKLSIHTRYGHLKAISVKVGYEVGFDKKSASSAAQPACPYELQVNGKA